MSTIHSISLLALALSVLPAHANLQESLEARSAASAERIPANVRAVMAQALSDLEASGITEHAVQVGERAPGFSLPDVHGDFVDSAALLRKGPIVLVFYRGAWCPFCNLTVAAYEQHLAEIEAAGATLVAISPEPPDAAASLVEKTGLTFPVLTDVNNAYARALGIVYPMSPELTAIYQQFQIPLQVKSGSDDLYELPLAATYVIDTDGTVRYAFLDVDYKKRGEPSDVIAVLKKL